ncbi:MAG: vWA domain-containing protein, partial [Candidatus Asgardarchaeum sp.]
MKQGLAKLVFIVDRSGSMSTIASDMSGAIKEVLKDQKETHKGEMLVTFVRFDSQYEEVFSDTPIADVSEIELKPRGSTALLDAIGRTINAVSEKFDAAEEDERPERVLFVIVTDGEENSSREFTKDKVFELIEEKKTKNRWGFTFIGANS